jgi:NSS family neurotransmitter:Na+ symporter
MVIYGSYLNEKDNLAGPAVWTVIGDTGSALVAGLAIIPAVIALGLEPTAGPSLLFSTIPRVFAGIPGGWLWGFLFFAGLLGAAYLSDIAAFEALVAGLTDNTRLTRKKAVWLIAGAVFVVSIPPSINNAIFVPWDLTFGSGMQTLGSLLAVVTLGWCVNRSEALRQLGADGTRPVPAWLFLWIRFGIPVAIIAVGVWWALSSVFGVVKAV